MDQLQTIGTSVPWMLTNGVFTIPVFRLMLLGLHQHAWLKFTKTMCSGPAHQLRWLRRLAGNHERDYMNSGDRYNNDTFTENFDRQEHLCPL